MQSIRCSHCGADIIGRYFSDYWGNLYCAAHYRNVPQCAYCGRLISSKLTKGGRTYSDGRRICGICLPSSVNDPKTGLELLQSVHDQLSAEGIIIKPFKPEFLLISRSKLKQLDKSSGEKQGFAVFNRKMINEQNQ